jgi:hypothetical protein
MRRLPRLPAAVVERAIPLAAAGLLVYRALAAATQHACH